MFGDRGCSVEVTGGFSTAAAGCPPPGTLGTIEGENGAEGPGGGANDRVVCSFGITARCGRPRRLLPTGRHIPEILLPRALREQFPTLEKVAVPSSVGVAFRIVMAMKQHFAGEARAALLAAMTANMRPKIVIVVDPDIDVPRTPLGPCRSTS